MVVNFPVPVLSVATDAVRDLEGRDALSGLWTLFTKCKESLQDGRRLENISWRLWYRELMLLEEERKSGSSDNVPLPSEKAKIDVEELVLDEKVAYQSPPQSEAVPIPPPPYPARDSAALINSSPQSPRPAAASSPSVVPSPSSPAQFPASPLLSPSSSEHKRRSSTPASTAHSRRGSFVNGIGKIIVDMLPTSSSSSGSSSASSTSDSSKGGMAALFLPGPVLSRKSTSTSISSSSSGDFDLSKVNSTDLVSVGTQLRHDPKIQMTPLPVAVGSSSPASSPSPPPRSILPVADGAAVRPRRCSIPEPPPTQTLQTLQSQNNTNPSCLPTPELEEAEPGLRIAPQNNPLASSPSASISTSSSSSSASSASTVPAFSSTVAIAAISHSLSPTSTSASNIANDSVDNSKSDATNESPLSVFRPAYTGPPSPSFSDSYIQAHPGEVEIREIGLLPSLSSTIVVNDASLHQPQELGFAPQHLSLATQTPPPSTSALQIPIMNAPSSSSQPEPPKLVVVNPTPNPTPHPTPPATPLLGGTIGPGGIIKTQYLTLPAGAAGTGARQHQLLQAAQRQIQQMQAALPQLSALRLPPPVAASGLATMGAAAGAARTDTVIDRSRSVTMPTTGGSGLLDFERLPLGALKVQQGHPAEEASLDVIPTAAAGPPVYADAGLDSAVSPLSSSRLVAAIAPIHAESAARDPRSELHAEGSATTPSLLPPLRSSVEREEGRTRMGNRHSISSTTSSSHSQISERSADSATTANTTVLSSSEAESHRVVEKAVAARALGSLSTIQSLSTLADKEKEPATDVVKEICESTSYDIISNEEAVDDEDATPLSPLPPPGGLAMSPRSDKRRKRNSAPAATTSSALLALSPTSSTSGQPPSPKHLSSSHSQHSSRKVISAGGLTRAASSGRSTSRSRSTGGSSLGKSRSRSREPGAGLGGLGMTAAAHAPPAVAAMKKAPHVAAGRGRAKITVGRAAASSRARLAQRRNSSGLNGSGAAAAEALEQELQREQEEREKTERLRAEALERERQRSLESLEDKRRVEEERIMALKEREQKARARLEAEQRRRQEMSEALANDAAGSSSKRQLKFNIGSNSDQGSGVDSKSAESASDLSGGPRGAGQGAREGHRLVEPATQPKGKERQREMDDEMTQHLQHQLQQFALQQQQRQLPAPNNHDHLSRDRENLQQHLQRQMSKQQLHQLQKMQQQHQQQHQNQSAMIHQHQQQQRQQQFQHHQQVQQLAQGRALASRQASIQQLNLEQGNDVGQVTAAQKGKGKEREVVVLSPKASKSNSKVDVALDNDLATKIKQSLAAPLLPQNKRTIVLATSESDFETDSEDEGSWSSEEMTGDEVAGQRAREEQLPQQELQRQYQQQLQLQRQRQQHQQQPQQQPPAHPPAVQRTQSSHYPAPNARGGGRQQRQSQVNTQAMIDKAALEVQRQRDMFVKLPASSFQDLAKARTRSVGLLTQLMNPNPEIFPADHPYRRGVRRGFSSGEIGMRGAPVAPMAPVTPAPFRPARAADTTAAAVVDEGRHAHQRRNTEGDGKRPSDGPGPSRSTFSPPSRALGLQRTKSAAAMPLSSQILAGSVSTKAPPAIDLSSAMPTKILSNGSSGGYRLKGPPEDQELEEDSGDEADCGIQVSKSVVQEKLKALAQRQGIVPNAQRNTGPTTPRTNQAAAHGDDDAPLWARVSRPPQHLTRAQSQGQTQSQLVQNVLQASRVGADGPSNDQPAAPIPLGYPYNLPLTAVPSTPRTTRRLMLSTELPESLRRNLLWERQVTKANGFKRSASGGGSRNSVLGGLQPLTAVPSMVQLHAKGTGPPADDDDSELRRVAVGRDEQERQDKRRRAMARNKSWANDYHYAGW